MSDERFHTLPKAYGVAGGYQSYRRGRGASPQWKEHYTKVSEKWGAIAAGSSQHFSHAWEDIRKQKEKGGYPWTHLEHDKEGEVWLDPLSLPKDISAATLRRKDRSIPPEWFHLPAGAETPTVEQLLKDSSSEDEDGCVGADAHAHASAAFSRAKSPPICGRSRSKSRERKLHKKMSLSQERHNAGYEPISVSRRAISATPSKSAPAPIIKPYKKTSDSQTPPTPPPKPPRNVLPEVQQQQQHQQQHQRQKQLPIDIKHPHLDDDDETSEKGATSCFPRSRSRSKSRDRSKANKQHQTQAVDTNKKLPDTGGGLHQDPPYVSIDKTPELKPKSREPTSRFLSPTTFPPPKVDRSSKPAAPEKTKSKGKDQDDGGYEPVGQERADLLKRPFDLPSGGKTKIYEDIPDGPVKKTSTSTQVQQNGHRHPDESGRAKSGLTLDARAQEFPPMDKSDEKEKPQKIAEAVENKQKEIEKEERERKIREKKEKEKKEKEEKEKKKKEEQERKQKEKEEKEKKEKEEKERKISEKREKEKFEKERKQKEKEEKERAEKEKKAKEKEEKELKAKEEKEKRENKEKLEKEQREQEKLKQMEMELKMKTKEEEEKKNLEEELNKQKDKQGKLEKDRQNKEERERKLKLDLDFTEKTEKEQKEKKEKEERLKKEKEQKEKKEKEEKEKKEKELKEKKEKEEKEKKETEQKEKDQKEKEEKQIKEKEEKIKVKSEKEKKEFGEEAKKQTDDADKLPERDIKHKKEKKIKEKEAMPMKEIEEKATMAKETQFKEIDVKEKVLDNNLDTEKEENQTKENAPLLTEKEELDEKERKRKDKEEKERIQKEEKERKKKEKEEKDREEKERKQREKEEKEKKEKEEKEKKLREKELKEREERERKMRDKEMKEKIEKEESERKQKEKEDKERKEKEERERKQREKEEKERKAKEDKERKQREKEEKEKADKERKQREKEEKDKKDKTKLEGEKIEIIITGARPEPEADPGVIDELAQTMSSEIMGEVYNAGVADQPDNSSSKPDNTDESKRKSWNFLKFFEKDPELEELKRLEREAKAAEEEAQKALLREKKEAEKAAAELAAAEKKAATEAEKLAAQAAAAERKAVAEAEKLAAQAAAAEKKAAAEAEKLALQAAAAEKKAAAEAEKLAAQAAAAEKKAAAEAEKLAAQAAAAEKKAAAEADKLAAQAAAAEKKAAAEAEKLAAQAAAAEKKAAAEAEKLAISSDKKIESEKAEKSGKGEKRSFFNFLRRKPKSKSLSDLNEFAPRPTDEDPGTFEEVQFSRHPEDGAVDEKNVASEELYEPVATKKVDPVAAAPPSVGPVPTKDSVFLTQPEEAESRSNSAMAAAVTHRGQRSPEPNDGFDDFARFQSGAAVVQGHPGQQQQQQDDYYDDDEDDPNFEPQNGYADDDDLEYDEQPEVDVKKKKERKPREPIRMPKVDLKAKFTAMNERVKKARMPSPHELKEGYLNSSFHKSFHQPLAVRSREMDDPEELEQRQALVKTKSPAELSQISSLSDLPVPTPIKNFLSPSERAKKAEEKKKSVEEPNEDSHKAWGMYSTLPRSMRETKLVTNCREMNDESELKQRQELVQSKNPTQLAEIHGLSDLPIPTKLEKIFKKPRSRSNSITEEKRARSESLPRTFGGTMYGTLPKSWRQQNLITQVKVEEDPDVLEKRRALTESKTPAELSQITSLSDLPIPTALEKYIKKPPKTETDSNTGSSQQQLVNRFRNLDSMYDTLPKSLKTEVLVRTKIETDEEVLKKRQEIVETKKPAELSQIQSLSDFPLPTRIENMFKTKEKDDNATSEDAEKKKMNLSPSHLFSYEALPDSLKTEVLVRTKVEEDPEVLRQRQETVQTKSPAELSRIHGFEDFPLPQKIETLVRTTKRHLKSTKEKEDMKDAKSKSWSSLPSRASLYDALPESLKTEVLVRSRVETPELQKERAETVKTKSVAELSQINSLSEFPLPKPIENLINTENKLGNIFDKSGGEPEGEPKTLRENFYDTLPRSLKSEVLVRVRDEDPEIQRQRQELTRAKSPTELSQIGSLSDFPIPTTIENLIKKKSAESSEEDPVPPPRRFKKETIYESLPDSLKTEVLVRTKIESDEKVLQRQELCRSKSPVQLSEIHDFSEIPLPTFVENLGKKTFSKKPTEQSEEAADTESPPEKKTFYDQLPESLRQECLVRSRFEDPVKQRMRAEIVKSKSVNELSQITSLNDFPLPATIENLIQRGPRPVERKKRFREKQRSLSAKNLRDRMYDTLPKSLKSEVLVKSKIEDPEVREERKKLVQSKSVNELSQINSLSDIPLPGTIEKLIAKAKPDPNSSTGDDSSKCQSSGVPTPAQIKENIYASLPRSLKSEVLVRTRVESPDVLKERQQLAQSKSVSELSQMRSISDLPIPTTIENLIQQAKALKEQKQEEQSDEPVSHARSSPGGGAGHYDIYASLPRSLKKEVMVRSKIEEDEELVRKRQALTESKTPAELSQINSFSEIPLPRRIEDWLHHSQEQKEHSEEATPRHSRSFHELRSSVYETIPKSLKEPTLVRSKIEDPEIQRERCEITRTKTPSQLAEFHNISDIPIPGLWERGRESRKNSCKVERSLSIPKNPQELKEIVYNKMMPESLTKPCVVRCKFEDPEILLKHQQVQQSKSIHELSKIRNLNEFPLPLNLRLPDLPLPSAKKLLKIMAARTPAARKPAEHTNGADTEISPASTPRTHDRTYTDDEMLRYDTGSPDSIAHREQDFGYEVIEPDEPLQHFDKVPDKFLADLRPQQQQEEEQDEESLAEQYRGTPPLRTKKKKQYRYSHEISDQVQITDEPPPPLPPKRPAGGTGTRRRDDQRQRSDEDYETDRQVFRSDEQQFLGGNEEPREILEENLGSNEMLLYVEPEDNPPVASLRKKHSMSGTAVQATLPPGPRIAYSYQVSPAAEEVEDRPASQSSRIQNRPLPAPPAPTRSLKKGTHRRTPSPHAAGLLARSSSASQADQFHSVASTLDRTLVDSSANRRRPGHHSDENDDTLADSIVDSMHSCADTLVGNGDDLDDATLHSCADTLADHDSDEEFFSEHLDVGGRQWRAAELPHDDDDTPTVSAGGDDLSTRLRNDTQELGRELLQHVENLRTTLDKMSHRLGTTPEPQQN